VLSPKKRVRTALGRIRFTAVDAASVITGRDFLLKIWSLAVSCPVGIAIVHEGIRPETMANIFYELGWMHADGRETAVIKIGDVKLPSDLVRTEYIEVDANFAQNLRQFLTELRERADYYLTLADQLEADPLPAIDYLRRAYLLTGTRALQRRAKPDKGHYGKLEPCRQLVRQGSRGLRIEVSPLQSAIPFCVYTERM
jgi:hypothetical protein